MDSQPLLLAVANDKYVKGISDLSEQGLAFHWLPMDQAFTAAWQSDAHFVTYYPVNSRMDVFPRFTKPLLPKMRHHGADIVTRIFAFDYDNPDHAPWTDDLRNKFWWDLAQCAKQWPMADAWSLLYTTRAGARLVYALDEPVPVDEAEGKHRWMVEQFKHCGLIVDRLSDWTRFFRMPYVLREGKRSWEDGQMFFLPRWENRIHAEDIPTLGLGSTSDYAEIREFREPKPLEEDAQNCLEIVHRDSGRKCQSEWYKKAKMRLKGRECFGCLFEHAPLALAGERDTTLHSFVGQAVSLLYYTEGSTPTHIYALFLDPVRQLTPDAQTPDWTTSLWSHVGRLWAREEAKARASEIKATDNASETLELIDKIVTGMREWCSDPRLHSDQPTARNFATEHLVCSADARFFVMTPSGWYDDMQVAQVELIPRVRALGMDQVIEIKQLREDGMGWKFLDAKSVIDRYATIVSSIRGVPQIKGGFIENLNNGAATLVVPSFCRNPWLQAEWSDDVDMWLQMLFGPRFLEGCEWISWALAFEEGPICALSLKGDPGIGKKLIAVGLKETLLRPKLATADDLVKENQYALLQSPFVHIDEGWPQGNSRGRHPADQFRALVSGQSFDCNRKFKAPIEVSNPVRILLTANNTNVVQMLTAGRDLSPEDRLALSIRLKHLDCGDKAAIWLRQRGGLNFTGQKGRRWIAGDGGEPSDYVVAKHFLWLYAHREKPIPKGGGVSGQRFLVEGDESAEITFEMRTNSGAAPLVTETLIKMLNMQQNLELMVVQDHRLFITSGAVLDYFRDHMSSTKKDLSVQSVANVLRGLMTRDWPNPMTLRDRPHLSARRWWELNPELLMNVARKYGWTCKKLEQLCVERQSRGLTESMS